MQNKFALNVYVEKVVRNKFPYRNIKMKKETMNVLNSVLRFMTYLAHRLLLGIVRVDVGTWYCMIHIIIRIHLPVYIPI